MKLDSLPASPSFRAQPGNLEARESAEHLLRRIGQVEIIDADRRDDAPAQPPASPAIVSTPAQRDTSRLVAELLRLGPRAIRLVKPRAARLRYHPIDETA